jgi:hypothetical protein
MEYVSVLMSEALECTSFTGVITVRIATMIDGKAGNLTYT